MPTSPLTPLTRVPGFTEALRARLGCELGIATCLTDLKPTASRPGIHQNEPTKA